MSSEETPERRLRRHCWLTPGISEADTEALVEILQDAEEAGRTAAAARLSDLEARIERLEGYARGRQARERPRR